MTYTFIAEHCSDLPVSICCRVLKVSTSGYYQRKSQPATNTELAEAYAANEVHDIWKMSRHSYGSPRVRTELVADAVQMATWKRRPPPDQVIAHSDHGSQYTSWLFGQKLRDAGLLGSMGSIGDCYDNSVAEAFFSILQRELLDQHDWQSRDQLAGAIFEWIEAWYNPTRRHSYNQGLSPIDYETANAA